MQAILLYLAFTTSKKNVKYFVSFIRYWGNEY